jgi:hypothetical protein
MFCKPLLTPCKYSTNSSSPALELEPRPFSLGECGIAIVPIRKKYAARPNLESSMFPIKIKKDIREVHK